MEMRDRAAIDGTSITRDGYLVASVKAARTGIQQYLGSEVGRPDLATVKVYRPVEQVFQKDTLASFTSIPVTVNHPPVMVDASNWRDFAVGNTDSEVARDGETMRIPLIVKDASAIMKIQDGQRELSCGYTCDLDWTAGKTADGLSYDAIQTNIRGNHLAIVDRARGGPELKIGDHEMPEVKLTTIVRDGVPVDVNDAAKIVIDGLDAKLRVANESVATRDTSIAALTTDKATLTAEVATLKKAVTDAALTPAKLRDAAAAYAKTVALAKALAPTIVIGDAMGEPEIKKAVVSAKLGDVAKDWNDAQVATSFATLASGVSVADTGLHTLAGDVSNIQTAPLGDKGVNDARAEMIKNLQNPRATKVA